MKFDRIDLIRWGALRDVSLDLSRGTEGLHVIYGDNEAGKSTTRRAISALLFGIPGQSSDDFRFGYKALRLGAVIRLADGSSFAFRRRKGNKDTVLDSSEVPISDAPLRRVLGGIERETFDWEWSLDHGVLRAGGEALRQGKGDLGQSLFAAGLGGIGVADHQTALEAEAKELFGKRSSKVRTLVEQVTERRKAREGHLVSSGEVELRRGQLARLRDERAELQDDWKRLGEELTRLDRIERGRPPLAARDRLVAELERFDGLRVVPDDFRTRRLQEQRSFDTARRDLEDVEQRLAEREKALAAVVVDHEILASSAMIEALQGGVAAYGERCERMDSWNGVIARRREDLRELAASVGLDEQALEHLAKGPYQTLASRARQLAQLRADARAQIEATRTALQREEVELTRLETAAKGAEPPPQDDTQIRRVFEHARRELSGAGKDLEKLRRRLDGALSDAAQKFADVELWSLGRAAFASARLPSLQAVDACEEDLKAEKAAEQARAVARDAESSVAKRGRTVAHLEASDVPREDALKAARERRDDGWKLVRQSLEGKAPSKVALQRFAGEEPLAEAFERAVAQADDVSDRLRTDAKRSGQLETAIEEKADAEAAWTCAKEDLTVAEEQEKAAQVAWQALWKPFEIIPRSPKIMRKWIVSATEVRTAFKAEEKAKAELEALEAHIRSELAPLAALIGRESFAVDDLADILDEAELRVNSGVEARRRCDEAERSLRQAGERVRTLREELKAHGPREEELSREWDAFVAHHALSARLSPTEVVVMADAASKAAGYLQQIEEARRSLEEAGHRHRAYVQDVRTQAAALRESFTEADVVAAVRTLHARLGVARSASRDRDEARDKVEAARSRCAEERRSLELADAAIRRLCTEAGTSDPQELTRIEDENRERRQLEAQLHEANVALAMLEVRGEEGVEALRGEVKAVSEVDLPLRRRQVEERRAALDESMKAKSQEIGAVENELGKATGRADAAEDESAVQGLVASVGEACAEFLRLSFAAQLLRRAAESYREQNQSPILRRTSELLGRLTLGSFTGVEVDEDGAKSVIKAVRGERELVDVEVGMSDGARDQLFLALRLAALERQLEQHEPLPFVVDDVLVNLSDDRARATLDVLAELAGHTQVLLFTHHSRVVELARGLERREVEVHAIGRTT